MSENLADKARQYNTELKQALQEIFSELNKGQTKKLLQNENVARLVEKYHIEHKGGES